MEQPEPIPVREVKRRKAVIGGVGNCWRKLLHPFIEPVLGADEDTEEAMSMHTFIKYCKAFVDFLGEEGSTEEWYLDIRLQPDGDFHLEDVYFRDEDDGWNRNPWGSAECADEDEFARYVSSHYSLHIPNTCIYLDDLAQMDPDVYCDASALIGAPYVPQSVKAQIPDAFDITLEPIAWEHSKSLLERLARWYWDFRSVHPKIPKLGPQEPPQGVIPSPPIPGPEPGAPVEDMPHFMSPMQELLAYLSHLASEAGSALNEVYQGFLDILRGYGLDLSPQIKYLILELPRAISRLVESGMTRARYFFEHWGLQHLLDHVLDLPVFLGNLIRDALHVSANFLEWGFVGIKLINFLLQDFTEYHGPEALYRRTLISGQLDFALLPEGLLEAHADVGTVNIPAGVPPRVIRMMREASEYDSNSGAAQHVNNLASDAYRQASIAIDQLPKIILPESTPDEDLSAFQNCTPTFNVVRGITDHPHPRPAGVRRYFRRVANDFLARRNRPVRAVGASNTEMPSIGRLIHNCWPCDSGRTAYRQKSFHTPANAAHRAMTHDHRFQDCDHGAAGQDVFGADIWSFFSAHDIPPAEFIREMAASASDTAVVALHLPFPLLDRRVTSYTDSLTGLHYEVHGEDVLVYHTDGHSAGYTHKLETIIAWMSNLPTFTNAHVQAETLAQVGTAVLLALTIAPGPQEVVPSLWQCQRDQFYLLPELLDSNLAGGELKFFAVAARKFEQLVAYVASLQPTQLNNEYIIPKIRGMMAEIRIGVHTVEPRWSVTLPQMYSLVKHAVIAHTLYSCSTTTGDKRLKAYYEREDWRHGDSLWKRLVQGRIDMMIRWRGEAQPLAGAGFWRWLTSNRYHHRGVFNPYQRAGTYRIAGLDTRHSNNLTSLGHLKDVSACCAKSVWAGLIVVGGVFQVTGQATIAVAGTVGPMVARARAALPALTELLPPASPDPRWVPLPPSEPDTPKSHATTVESDIYSATPLPSPLIRAYDRMPSLQDLPPLPNSPHLTPQKEEAPPASSKSPESPEFQGLDDLPGLGEVNFKLGFNSPPASVASDDSVGSDAASVLSAPALVPEPGPTNDDWLAALAKRGVVYSLPKVGISACSPRKMDFLAPCVPIANEHTADQLFRPMMAGRKQFVWPTRKCVVPCPSNGGVEILEAAYLERNLNEFPYTDLPALKSPAGGNYRVKTLIRSLDSGADNAEAAAAITASVTRFAEQFAPLLGEKHRIKICTVLGPPMSAKSSLMRAFVKAKHKRAIVYVPSKALKEKGWSTDADFLQMGKIYYRNQVPRRSPAQVGIIDEVFNWSPLEIGMLLRLFASKGIRTCYLVGDPSQCAVGGIARDHPFLDHCLQLHTSLGMPRDAHGWFLRINALPHRLYTTTGTSERSIFFVEKEDDLRGYNPDLEFKMHSHAPGNTSLTVGRVQGSRAVDALFRYDLSVRQASWLNDTPAFKSVAISRHTQKLVILCNGPTRVNLEPTMRYQIVGARVDTKHVYSPSVADDLVVPINTQRVTSRISRLRAVLSAPLALEGHAVVTDPIDKPALNSVSVSRPPSDLRTMVLEQTNFSLPEPAERDFVTAKPLVSFRFRAPGPPTHREDVRNDVENAHLLAAIHVNSSAFDAAKNLIDRQIATTKKSSFRVRDRQEGLKMYRRFRECFYASEAALVSTEVAVSWLADTEVAALANIACSDSLGETASTLTCDAEFKTQTKAKAQPGFAATLPYGQSIIANKKVFNAHFASEQPKMYTNLIRLMRPGVFVDYGVSDEQLSNRLQKFGVAHQMNGPHNFQADVSKQDSSHTPAFLVAFLLVAKDCGVSDEACSLYLAYCQRYGFTSRGEDAIRAAVSYNLGSGDPFTLIRNNLQEMTTIACRYQDAKTMVIVEKGDDVHGVLRSLTPHRYATLRSVASVKLTTDWGAVGYHAGRFHNGTRYLVDPVRAFLKHFTRLSDENVSIDELYNSYVSRATDYSDDEVSFLSVACQAHYPHYASDVVDAMIHIMIEMRERRVFEKYCTLKVKPFSIAVDSQRNCVEQCLRLMRPRWPKAKLRSYRDRDFDEVRNMLAADGVAFVVVDGHYPVMTNDVLHLSRTHARVRVSSGAMTGSAEDL